MIKPPTGCRIKSGRYYRVIYTGIENGKRKQTWVPLTKTSEGLAALYVALARLESKPTKDTRMPQRITQWLTQALQGLSVTEQKEQARMGVTLSAAFVEFRTEQVQARHILAFLQQFTNQGKRRTAQRYKAVLTKFFRWCIVQGDRVDNPVQAVRTPPPLAHKRYITDAEFLAIRAKLDPMPQIYVDLLYLTGQRGMDIRTLKWADISDGVIHFQPSKTMHSTGVKVDWTISPAIKQVLERAKEYMRTQSRMSPFVVHTRQGGAYTKSGIYSAWRRALLETKLPACSLKDLRAKHGTDAEKCGHSVGDISKGYGHSDESMTRTYLKQRQAMVATVALSIPESST